MQYEKNSVFCRKQFCHLGRTAQQKFGRSVWPNQTFGRSLLCIVEREYIAKQGPSKYFTLARKLEKIIKFELEKISSWFQTGKKIQFIKLDISNWRIEKIQFRQIGSRHCWKYFSPRSKFGTNNPKLGSNNPFALSVNFENYLDLACQFLD